MPDSPLTVAQKKASARSLFAVLIFVCVLSFSVRELSALLVQAPDSRANSQAGPGADDWNDWNDWDDWIVTDPDGLYHARRVLRAIEGDTGGELLPIAGTDPHLDYPTGAAIPWPPYYDLFLYGTIAPFAPKDEAEKRRHVEHSTATWPLIFGVLTTLLVAYAGALLAGLSGALAAGMIHALAPAASIYAKRGVADHHAFVAMLLALLLALSTRALLRYRELDGQLAEERRRALFHGVACGATAGVLLGSWVASLVYVALVDVVLGILILRDRKGTHRSLHIFGLSFHLSALAVLIPAVIDSPWLTRQPWSVVNLSQFHPAFLFLGTLVFVPLPWLAGRSIRNFYPLLVIGTLTALTAILCALDSAPWLGIREAFAWADRSDAFMSSIQESRPLWQAVRGNETGGLARAHSYLGYGFTLLPIAWCLAAALAFRAKRDALLPLLVFAPVLLLQALQQTRFTDVLTIPLALLIGFSVAWVLERLSGRLLKPLPRLLAAGLCICLLQAPSIRAITRRVSEHGLKTQYVRMPRKRAARAAFDWLRARQESTKSFGDEPGSVLANWSRGHAIEWAAGLPTVTTNFGSYLGTASWVDPGRILLETSMPAAEEALKEREIRWVFLSSEFPNALPTLSRAAFPEERDRFVARSKESAPSLKPAYFETLGVRLMFGGQSPLESASPQEAISFLRLVRVSPERDPRPKLARFAPNSPMNWVWERVAGATLELGDANHAGRNLEVTIQLEAQGGGTAWTWSRRAPIDSAGRATLRIPYATDVPNGDVRAVEAYAQIGPKRIELSIPESAVVLGERITL